MTAKTEQKDEVIKHEKRVISVPEAAQLLGVSRSLAFRMARNGQLPAIRLGERRLVVPVLAVEKILNSWQK
jgi:excisionase family DNA binding protein